MHLGYNSPLIWISITIQWSMIQHHTCKVKIIDSINKIWLHVEIPMARICHFFGPSIPLSSHSNSAEKQMMAWSQEKKIKIFTLFLGGGDNQPCGNMLDSREMTAQQTNTGSYSAVCQLVAAAVLAAPFQQWKNMHAGWNSIVVFCWLMQWFKPTVSIKSINNICSLYSYEEKKSLLVTKIP